MPVHTDNPGGKQYHVRYLQETDEPGARPFWWTMRDTAEEAAEDAAWLTRNGQQEVQIFVRDISPWRPLDA